MRRYENQTRLAHENTLKASVGPRVQRLGMLALAACLAPCGVLGQSPQAVSASPPEPHAAAETASTPAIPTPQQVIAQQSQELLLLATQLKAEVDKTGTDRLSLDVVRTAKAIEKVARGVKDKIKHCPGAS